jgi:hypothetical protein
MDDAFFCVFLIETIYIRKKKQCQVRLFRSTIDDIWASNGILIRYEFRF